MIFKRYGNRKFYNVDNHNYATLGYILEQFSNGYSVSVYCNKTKEDITRKTITAALFEEQNKAGVYKDLSGLFIDAEILVKAGTQS